MASVPRCDGMEVDGFIRHNYSKYPWADGLVGGYDGTEVVKTLILDGKVDLNVILSFIRDDFPDVFTRYLVIEKNLMPISPFFYLSFMNYRAKNFVSFKEE